MYLCPVELTLCVRARSISNVMCPALLATAAIKIANDGEIVFATNSSASFNPQASPSSVTLSSRNSTILSSQMDVRSISDIDSGLCSRNLANSSNCVSHCGFSWWPNSGAAQRKKATTAGRLRSSSRSSRQRPRTLML